MKCFTSITSCVCGLLVVCLLVAAAQAGQDSVAAQAKEILDIAGVPGGIVVHLGCGDGKLTAALRANDSYTVVGLEADAAKVGQARKYIQEQGIYGDVSVEQHSGQVLAYTDNLINLVVVQDAGQVPMDEVMRVLAPGAVACVQRGGKWQRITKARPGNIDEWSHFLHDASNNAVAKDSVVGPPRSLQWVAPPLWLRSHETPSGIESTISAGGRMFYFFDEGLIGITDERLPDRWSLICRDAFNGKLLWKRPLKAWGWREWNPARWEGKDWTTITGGRTDVPNENQRRIVADGDRVYTTLSYGAPMSILDAATGNVIATVEQTQDASEILTSDGSVLVYTQSASESVSRRRGAKDVAAGALVAVNGRTGKVLWEKQTGQIRPLMLAIDNGRIIYLTGKDLVALDLKDGHQLWKVQPKQNAPKTLLTVDDVVVMQGGKLVAAHDAVDGKLLWDKTVPQIG
ncbi:MAG TPA: PQQ-binding-like beta-propeller repeat protein, partial [Sedimentisphaerales bacterium]|nr:PQQ-binding-like beta-propeller repeat protein [Sedimentisphaerales bacterium]